jgi:hypothetical protein
MSSRNASPSIRAVLFLCLGLALFAALFATPVLAAQTHLYTGVSFGPDGTAATSFGQVQSIAIDPASKDIYVYDGSGSIYKFDAAHQPVKFSGLVGNVIEGVGSSSGAENQVAIAPPGSPGGTAGDIYAANNSVIKIFAPSGTPIGELTGGETCGVATDPAGHVFAGVYSSEVREYVPSANPPVNADQKNASNGAEQVCNVSADGLGNVYAAAFSGSVIVKLAGLGASNGTRIQPGAPTIGIDPASNDLYADRGEEVAQYDSSGALIATFGSSQLSSSRGVAINGTSGNVYVGNGANGRVDVFGPLTLVPDAETKAATAVKRVSATLNGTIGAAGGPQASCEFQYVTEAHFQTEGFAGATSTPCDSPGPFSGSSTQAVKAEIGGLSTDTSYRFRVVATSENGSNPGAALGFTTPGAVNVKTGAASGIDPTSATLSATINPEGIELQECLFEYGTEGELDQTQPCAETPAQIGSGETAVPVHADLTGLTPDVSYSFRIAASNSLGERKGDVNTFETFGPPTIQNQAVVKVTITSAIFTGQVNPHGQATGFQVEYVSEADFDESGYVNATRAPATPVEVGEGLGPVEVTLEVTGLSELTTYHARLVASNTSDTVRGPDTQFTTYSTAGLPEGRAYEMVSPPLKIGDIFPPEPTEELGGSRSCSEFCQPGLTNLLMPIQSDPSGEALSFVGQAFAEGQAPSGNQYISRRSPTGWTSQDATPLRADKEGGFKALSPDLDRGVLLQSSPALSPEAPIGENGEPFPNFYLWEEGNPDLQPLVTVQPPHRAANNTTQSIFRLFFGGGNSGSAGSPAFAHLVFEANDALTPAVPDIAPAAPEAETGECGDDLGLNHLGSESCDIYEWFEGQLRLVNVLPGNTTAAQHAVLGSGRRLAFPEKEAQTPDVDHAISADGSRIFWSDESGQVYVRINGEETVELNDPGQFITATPDGSKVMLSDGCIYSLASESCEATLGNDPSAFLGIAGASDDLSRVYFVDKEALVPGAQVESCKKDESGGTASQEEGEGEVPPGRGCNLYVYDNGNISQIATLSESDNTRGLNGRYGDWKATPSLRTAQVSTDGRFLAFVSTVQLTGYDNRRLGNVAGSCSTSFGAACTEVYQYDLDSHSLRCASCNPSGLRPLGRSSLSLVRSGNDGAYPQLRNLPSEGEGQVFFESVDALSAGDHNGRVQDIYEWRPDGVGGCGVAKGCITLISSGGDSVDSFFLTTSPSGRDAYFITREQLLLRDTDDFFDVYDARAGGGINENLPPPCLGEACKGPATSAPEVQSAGTAQFSGPGNEKPHKKPKKHKHKKKRKSKKHKSKSTKKAHERAAESNRGGQK